MTTPRRSGADADDGPAASFLAGLDGDELLLARITDRLHAQVPDYWPMSREQHVEMLREEYVVMTSGSPDGELAPEELDRARHTGAARARQGISLGVMVEAMSVTLRLLWEELLAEAGEDATLRAALAARMLQVWRWSDSITAAAVVGHHEASQELRDSEAARLLDVLDRLAAGPPDARVVLEARRLGFDPDEQFVVASLQLEGFASVRRVARQLPRATMHATPRGSVAVVVAQGADPAQVVTAFTAVSPGTAVGVGNRHAGLASLGRGLMESQRVLSLALLRRTALSYDDHWFLAILLEDRQRLPQSLEHGSRIAAENPHLAEAVAAFADHGLAVAPSARELHVHANTLRYRLERWAELTGWDPHTFEGLAHSITAIELAR